ncbi:MAG: hypothetical protein HRT36_02500 [Alphaproteobacteria bacterium]|nr:hypothetical protein [Alphaproteobacteria bacterium]
MATGAGLSPGVQNSGPASQYQPLTNQQDYRQAKTEQKIVTDGCTVRIDAAQNVAIQQSKAVLYEEGKVKSLQCLQGQQYPLYPAKVP